MPPPSAAAASIAAVRVLSSAASHAAFSAGDSQPKIDDLSAESTAMRSVCCSASGNASFKCGVLAREEVEVARCP